MSFQKVPLAGSTVIAIATITAYHGVLRNDFVDFDDSIYVTHNTQTAAGITWSGFRYAWSTFESGNWIPLTWLSFQLDATLFGMKPLGFHLTNLLLHIANSVLLFTWLTQVTGSRWHSLTVAAIFGLHPLRVESVAWIAERKDVLSSFWMLLSLHGYERYARQNSTFWYVATCVEIALGLLSKSMLVTLPVLLLLVDIWPLGRWRIQNSTPHSDHAYPVQSFPRIVLEKMPMFGLSVFAGIATVMAASQSNAFTQSAAQSFSYRFINAIDSYAWYLAKTIYPTSLAVLYPHPSGGLPTVRVVIAVVTLILISVYVAKKGLRRKHLLFGWFWFLTSLLPVIGLLQFGSQAHADRYTYVPHIGLLILIVWELADCLRLLSNTFALPFLLTTIIAATCGWLTMQQVTVWQTTETLWKHAISINPENAFAHSALGNCFLESGELDAAKEQFEIVVKQFPKTKESYAKLVDIYRRHSTGELGPSEIRNELGMYYASERKMESARIRFAQAVAISPENVVARNNLSLVLTQLGRDDEAMVQFQKVLSQDPECAVAHAMLGSLLEKRGHLLDARDHFASAFRLNPRDTDAGNRLRAINQRLSSGNPIKR